MATPLSSRILVVDDEVHIVELARLYLTREGYEVEGVGDGGQAMARFAQVKPDLVILDIMLPGTDGLTICKEIRKLSQVPIIMLTARDEVTDKVVGLEVGADDYLTKRSTWNATRSGMGTRRYSCARRSSTCSPCSRGIPAAYSNAASCSTSSGDTTSRATLAPWTSTFSRSARSSRRRASPTPASRPCGASDTAWS